MEDLEQTITEALQVPDITDEADNKRDLDIEAANLVRLLIRHADWNVLERAHVALQRFCPPCVGVAVLCLHACAAELLVGTE